MTLSAAQRGWGSGWPHCNGGAQVTITCGANTIRLSVRGEVTELVSRLVAHLEAERGRGFEAWQSGGFCCRPIAETTTPSNHSWGLAVDLDSADNPQAKRSYHEQHGHPYPGGLVLVSTMPQNAAAIGGRYGFRWGGTYGGTTKPDPMHFEFMGTPGDAARLAVITRSGGFNDVGTLEGNQKSQLSNADQRTKAILEILRDGGPDATVGRRTKEMTIILRSLTGFATEEELEDAFSKGTDTRALLKSLVEGAVLDGLREPDDAHPGRGTLRVPLKKILHEVLDERANA